MKLVKGDEPARRAVRRDAAVYGTRIEAANAADACALVAAGRVDIVLIDDDMPGTDGLELTGELRASTPDIPIALITADVQDEVLQTRHARRDQAVLDETARHAHQGGDQRGGVGGSERPASTVVGATPAAGRAAISPS